MDDFPTTVIGNNLPRPGDESDPNDEESDEYDFSDEEYNYDSSNEPPEYPEFYNFLT